VREGVFVCNRKLIGSNLNLGSCGSCTRRELILGVILLDNVKAGARLRLDIPTAKPRLQEGTSQALSFITFLEMVADRKQQPVAD
jgi:hypothetical protein